MPVIFHIGPTALVMVEETSLQRIGSRDPLIIDVGALAQSAGRPVTRMVLTLGTAEDVAETLRLLQAGQANEAARFACRGTTKQPGDEIGLRRIPLEEVPS